MGKSLLPFSSLCIPRPRLSFFFSFWWHSPFSPPQTQLHYLNCVSSFRWQTFIPGQPTRRNHIIPDRSMTSSQPTSSAQFWDDFWNTLYQFTHPFSSTFFDSLMDDASASASNSAVPPVQQEQPPQQQYGQKKHFADPASFEKFWHQLHGGAGAGHHQGSPSPTTVIGHMQVAWTDMKAAATGFISSVEWEQTWIQIILALHLIIFITIILLRNKPNALGAMLFCSIVLAALSEPLNGIGHRHWQLFSDDNYFDSHGVFMSLVWALPLLINAILAVLLLLRATIGLLIKVKRAQVQKSRTRKRK